MTEEESAYAFFCLDSGDPKQIKVSNTTNSWYIDALPITERKRAEDALSESEKHLNMAEHMGQTGSWVYNLETDNFRGRSNSG